MVRRRIFLVDDNPEFIIASRRFLSFEPDIEVVGWASSGAEALEQVPRLRPDVVLMDLTMPNMNGLETTRRLKAQSHRPAVVILTIHQSDEFRTAAKDAGADSYISKSDLVDQLPPFLRTLFDGLIDSQPRLGSARPRLGQNPLEILGYNIEERFHAIVEFSPDPMLIIDQMRRIVLVNAQTERLFGYIRDEILGRPIELLIPVRFPDVDGDLYRLDSANRGPYPTNDTVNLLALRKDGTEVPVEISLSPVQSDPVILFAVSIRDITARKQAEQERQRLLEAVEQQRAELQMLLDSVPALIFFKDRQHRLVRVNQAHAQCFGLPKEQIEGKTDAELGSPYAGRYMLDDLQVLTTGKPLRGIIEEFHSPSGKRWIQTEKVPHRDIHGNIIGVVGLAVDITEKKNLEEQLRQSQKLDAIGQLAGGVAHDFNNLLTVIDGYSEILLEDIGPGDSHHPMLQEIKNAGERAAGLVRQLLAFSRKQVLEPKVLDLNELVDDVEKMLRRLIGEHVELRTLLTPGLGRVLADAGQLEQVMLNLAVNARDAMPKGGRLTIETACVELSDTNLMALPQIPPGCYVVLTFRDTGCGMDPQTKARIFEPFFTTKELGKGTGLGLATVFGIVTQSHGHIQVETELGAGSAFRVYLPKVVQSESISILSPVVKSPKRGSETVLLVEDDANVRELALRILRMNGYNILEAVDGKDALRVAEEYPDPIDLMITDLVMPRLGGGDLAHQLSLLRPSIKVLYLSGYSAEMAIGQGLLIGDVSLVQKPFTPGALALKVREVLDRKDASVRS
ncbi:MAG: Blue-light-activated protein [Planctomycetaceae bacterium]|nr:Blue-light-activated protein [Planctomycetaceae bacterium]